MDWNRGYLTLTHYRGAPVRVHWTTPLGAFVFGGMTFAPVFWVAFVTLVLVHELGHAFLVRRFGHRVEAIDVTGLGGVCRWAGAARPLHRGLIAWGGVLAQLLLLGVTVAAVAVVGTPTSFVGAQLVHAFVTTNLWLVALNLLPVAPFDGAEAWPAARELVRRARERRSHRTRVEPRARRSPPASPTSDDGRRADELAAVLRGVAEEARRARRGR
jgi:Zn-dependent protease